jgi:GGDEF domain-containing protein
LHDALTGALSLPAFNEAVAREIARAGRDSMELHLLLLNLQSITKSDFNDFEDNNPRQKSIEQEQLLIQLVEMVHELKISLRDNDLISRTGFSEISIVFSGNPDDLKKRILKIVKNFSGTVAMVKYQEDWKLAQFLTAGDLAIAKAAFTKTL